MFLFMLWLVLAAGCLGFFAGVLIVGATAYDAGYRAHARRQANDEAERRRAGFRVVG